MGELADSWQEGTSNILCDSPIIPLYHCHFPVQITPSTPMGELADSWAVEGKKNVFGGVMNVTEMESETGVAGAEKGCFRLFKRMGTMWQQRWIRWARTGGQAARWHERWATDGKKDVFGALMNVTKMESETGVAGHRGESKTGVAGAEEGVLEGMAGGMGNRRQGGVSW
jgi:hypothetical protein